LTADRWPFPEDTTLERARKVARSYRALAMAADPAACAVLDERSEERGQGWVVPRADALDLDDLVGVRDLSHLLDVPEKTLYRWGREGKLEKRCAQDGSLAFLMRDVVDLCAAKRRRARHDAATRRQGA
jgi:hypothetical protein